MIGLSLKISIAAFHRSPRPVNPSALALSEIDPIRSMFF